MMEVADSVKFSSIGLAWGVLTGGATEFVASEIINALDLKEQDIASTLAEVLVRGSLGSIAFLFAGRIFASIDLRRDDPTQGTYFTYGFGTSQFSLYSATVRLSKHISNGFLFGIDTSTAPCCSDCAKSGGSCSK